MKPAFFTYFIITLLAITATGCYNQSSVEPEQTPYPKVKQLITQALQNRNTGYTKTATLQAATETQHPDTLHRKREADLLTVADINKPAWIGFFEIDTLSQNPTTIAYTTQKEKIKVKNLTTTYNPNGQITQLKATINDKNMLFDSHRQINITFDYNPQAKPYLVSYLVDGYQKVLLKDTSFYQIALQAKH